MKLFQAGLLAALMTLPTLAVAQDVYIGGYYRSDGTYVRPHIRSQADGILSNNYGRSTNSFQLMNPGYRDADNDGIQNNMDFQYNAPSSGLNTLASPSFIFKPNF